MYEADSKVHIINHFKTLLSSTKTHNLSAHLNIQDFILHVQSKQKMLVLHPQFLEIIDDKPHYTEKLTNDSVCFIGWRPYPAPHFSIFPNKIKIKDLVKSAGLSTPEYSTDNAFFCNNIIVKDRVNSFGKGMHGPFRSTDEYDLSNDQFYEKFIEGTILKVSFWNETPLYLEEQVMPKLIGDGKQTILDLAHQRAEKRDRTLNLEQFDEMLCYHDLNPEDVLPKGDTLLADFRYESDMAKLQSVKERVIDETIFRNHIDEFHLYGQLITRLFREKVDNLYYNIDLIRDDQDRLWFLEANANPTVHQSAYKHFIAHYFNNNELSINPTKILSKGF